MASRNERLRDLLARARRELGTVEALTVHPGFHDVPGGDSLLQFLQQIDAALAEPTDRDEIEQLRTSRDIADSAAYLAETCLQEIVELVGEGGDGTAFGSVESMMQTHAHLEDTLRNQRDMALAEVMRFKKAIHTRACQNQSAYNLECVCGADEHQRDLQKLAFRRGAEAMRESAMATCNPALRSMLSRSEIIEAIRNVPIPEDKP